MIVIKEKKISFCKWNESVLLKLPCLWSILLDGYVLYFSMFVPTTAFLMQPHTTISILCCLYFNHFMIWREVLWPQVSFSDKKISIFFFNHWLPHC